MQFAYGASTPMSTFSKRITDLSPEKRALLVRQLAKKRAESDDTYIRPQRRDINRFPLSFAQQRLWFLEQLTPGLPIYNVSAALHLAGPLQVATLRHSLTEIVRRHEALRTTFGAADGTPFQVIAPPRPQPLALLDLRRLPAPQREAQARRLARAEALQPFDLAGGPLMRTT